MTARTTFLLTTVVAMSLFAIAATSSVVLAQQGTTAACSSDVDAHCAGTRGESRAACIKLRFKDFSLACQLALVKARAVRKACRADVKKNCADIKPGGGRIEACLKDHFADVSDPCNETISQAAGKS
jgi:hypothetical protein